MNKEKRWRVSLLRRSQKLQTSFQLFVENGFGKRDELNGRVGDEILVFGKEGEKIAQVICREGRHRNAEMLLSEQSSEAANRVGNTLRDRETVYC